MRKDEAKLDPRNRWNRWHHDRHPRASHPQGGDRASVGRCQGDHGPCLDGRLCKPVHLRRRQKVRNWPSRSAWLCSPLDQAGQR